MKKKLIVSCIVFSAISAIAWKTLDEKGGASVSKLQGVYIFMFSQPTGEYDYLGTVKAGMTWEGSPVEVMNSILKRAKKQYPDVEGIIFSQSDPEKADAI